WQDLLHVAKTKREFDKHLPSFIQKVKTIPKIKDLNACPKVLVTGDFFVRYDSFFIDRIHQLYTAKGIILKPVDFNELLLYLLARDFEEAALKVDSQPYSRRALFKVLSRCLGSNGKTILASLGAFKVLERAERKAREKFKPTGLLFAQENNLGNVITQASFHIHPSIWGEGVLTIGKVLETLTQNYDGVLILGPFSCLPFRLSEAILRPLCFENQLPFLTYETDGRIPPPTFLRSVAVHIQQVLRIYEKNQNTQI
ncbi:MAG: hypothetical protein ACFFBD_10580, partial [Candidatus Hodarchaeota archaeon]